MQMAGRLVGEWVYVCVCVCGSSFAAQDRGESIRQALRKIVRTDDDRRQKERERAEEADGVANFKFTIINHHPTGISMCHIRINYIILFLH